MELTDFLFAQKLEPTPDPAILPPHAKPVVLPWSIPEGYPTPDPALLVGTPLVSSKIPETTLVPTAEESLSPTKQPTVEPTEEIITMSPILPGETHSPSQKVTLRPTKVPSSEPTMTSTSEPSSTPVTLSPTRPEETRSPSKSPTQKPTKDPTQKPTQKPTINPTLKPSEDPTAPPTEQPSQQVTFGPTLAPSPGLSSPPTSIVAETIKPSNIPISAPSASPIALTLGPLPAPVPLPVPLPLPVALPLPVPIPLIVPEPLPVPQSITSITSVTSGLVTTPQIVTIPQVIAVPQIVVNGGDGSNVVLAGNPWWASTNGPTIPHSLPPVTVHNQKFLEGCDPQQCILQESAAFHSMSNEDESIYELFYSNPIKCCLVVVEVGAGDGDRFSTSRFFEDGLKWRSLLIESDPELYQELEVNRPSAITKNGAFCESDHILYDNGKFHSLGGSVEVSSELHTDPVPDSTTQKQVPCLQMDKVFGNYSITHVDVMIIRVQGDGLAFIRSMDWTVRVDIWVVLMHGSTVEERNNLVRSVLKNNEYVRAEWDVKRWCGATASCLKNEVFLRKGFDYELGGTLRRLVRNLRGS